MTTNSNTNTLASAKLTSSTEQFRNIVTTFPANQFRASGYFTASEHYQTIVGSGALSFKLNGFPKRPFQTKSEIFDTPDGDIFEVEYTENFESNPYVVIILHGLESSPKGILVTRFATAFLQKGFDCCLFGFRGCNGELPRTPGGYHVGFTQDISQLIDTLHQRYPNKYFYLSGFSLGGNVSLKYLGELGDQAIEKNILGAAVTSVPFDPAGCQRKIDRGFNRIVYSKNFLTSMKVKAEDQHKKFPGSFDIEGVRKAKSIGEVDEAFIAKIYHFKDKFDYYRQCGSKWWLSKIRVPVFAMNAIDDPFIDETSLPNETDVGEAPVRLIYHANGGHCGFATNRMSVEADSPPVPEHGWLAEELSRMIHHLHKHQEQQLSSLEIGEIEIKT